MWGCVDFLSTGVPALGTLLRKWEESSSRDNLAFLYLCMCVSDIVFLPRGTIAAITSQILYASMYMLLIYLFDWAMANSSSSVQSAARLRTTGTPSMDGPPSSASLATAGERRSFEYWRRIDMLVVGTVNRTVGTRPPSG